MLGFGPTHRYHPSRRMRRAVATCLMLAVHAVFLLAISFGAPCLDQCEDDGLDGRCPPACMACPCSPKAGPVAAVSTVAAPAASPSFYAAFVARAPRAPEPHDIFHVPKLPLA
jgi:hypothetical protein